MDYHAIKFTQQTLDVSRHHHCHYYIQDGFLPSSIKLGIFNGQYRIVMRRRTELEDRETVWISMVTKKRQVTVRTHRAH